ncbi:excisionase [Duganella sp. Leaf126]|uniref:GAF domain-containing protein n=1 Tax=Duganella sp. Leaf126 TaxID=1736266 RepID=UPI0006FA8399|nr:GAF domain-containing protein [Duganella sp. Leaf126]KQQ47327.1 excisionase [Duganella sp. Leaf126]
MPNSKDSVLTTRATAELLGVAVSTAQLWIENGAIPSWKTPGGHRRVRLSAVKRLMEQRGLAAPAAMPVAAPRPVPATASHAEFLPAATAAYPVSHDEARRLLALDATGLVDTPAESVFDRLTWLASQMTDSPMALISLATAERLWFKSRVGVDAVETPRDWAFCSHAILQDGLFMVEDAARDPRFQDSPHVTGAPHIRFYAAFPLYDNDQLPLGTLCVLDREPRRLRDREIRALRELADIASEEIQRRTRP